MGALLATVGIVLYVVAYGRPSPTGPDGEITLADHAAYMVANWELARGIWLIELAGDLFLALGGFLLQHRRVAGSRSPTAVGWLAIGIGATILAVMHAFIIGSYSAAAPAYAEDPTLFTVLQDAANVWFYSGTTALFAGLTGVFRAEVSAHRRTIPRWSAALGAVAAGVAGIQAFAMLIGGIAFMQVLGGALFAVGFGAVLIAYPLMALLGVAIWREARQAT